MHVATQVAALHLAIYSSQIARLSVWTCKYDPVGPYNLQLATQPSLHRIYRRQWRALYIYLALYRNLFMDASRTTQLVACIYIQLYHTQLDIKEHTIYCYTVQLTIVATYFSFIYAQLNGARKISAWEQSCIASCMDRHAIQLVSHVYLTYSQLLVKYSYMRNQLKLYMYSMQLHLHA